MNGFEQ